MQQAPQHTTAAAADGPQLPQRVLPYGIRGDEVAETPEEQAAIIARLQHIMNGPGNGSAGEQQQQQQQQQQPRLQPAGAGNTAPAAAAPAAAAEDAAGADPADDGVAGADEGDAGTDGQAGADGEGQQPSEDAEQPGAVPPPLADAQQPESVPAPPLGLSFKLSFDHHPEGPPADRRRRLQQDAQELPGAVVGPSWLDCPDGTVANTTDGTCTSGDHAFPDEGDDQEPTNTTTVMLDAPAMSPAQLAAIKPIDSAAVAAEVPTPGDGAAPRLPASRAAAAAPAPYTGPDSTVSRTLTLLGNTKIKVGLDLDRAGTISWVSSPLAPAPFTNRNIINVWDQGRLLQQSFYGCLDGSCWASRPLLWNPVQGGSWQNALSQTTKKQVAAGKFIYAEGLPRNWGQENLIRDVKFTTNVTLLDSVAVVKFTMIYTGSVTHPYMTQEVPAVFVDRRFSVLAFYNGSRPWTNDRAITYAFPPSKNIYTRPTEAWAAFVDPATGCCRCCFGCCLGCCLLAWLPGLACRSRRRHKLVSYCARGML